MALTRATWSLDRRPCFVCAAMTRALPSGVRGPVDLPPCSLQRLRSLMAGFWHAPPARVFTPHLRPGQFKLSVPMFQPFDETLDVCHVGHITVNGFS